MLRVLARVLLSLAVAAPAAAGSLSWAQEAADPPHILDCAVRDTILLTQDGSLVPDKPLPPGARAVGRVTSFQVDTTTGVVRLPGKGNIAWVVAKGDANTKEMILTPGRDPVSAATVSIHLNRSTSGAWFVFFETDRMMSGTCVLLP
jgi:hypothetical protein